MTGSTVDDRPPHAPESAPSRRRWSRRTRLVAGILVGAVLLAVLGFLVVDLVQQHRGYDQAHASLLTTRHRSALVSGQLARLHHDLDILTTQVGNDSTALAQVTAQLKGAQWALALTRANVTQQSTLITSLQTCLGGVEQALNSLAVGSQDRAASELSAVSSSCTTAAAASG